jgi:hypothetical protein
VKAATLAGTSDALLLKGARIPSTADDDCAEIRRAALRPIADLRWGLDRFSFMIPIIPHHSRRGGERQLSTHNIGSPYVTGSGQMT